MIFIINIRSIVVVIIIVNY